MPLAWRKHGSRLGAAAHLQPQHAQHVALGVVGVQVAQVHERLVQVVVVRHILHCLAQEAPCQSHLAMRTCLALTYPTLPISSTQALLLSAEWTQGHTGAAQPQQSMQGACQQGRAFSSSAVRLSMSACSLESTPA